MKRRTPESFRNSELDRVRPRRHFFRALINNNLKRHRSDTGLVEDRANSVTVIRIIVALLLLHLIVIGGVILRGKMISDDAIGVAPAITPPPAAPAQPEEVLPQPVAGPVANPVRSSNHITQAALPDMAVDDAADEVEIVTPPAISGAGAAPAEPTAPVAPPAADDAPVVTAKHLVASGETLYGIASKYHVTVDAIRRANPKLRGNNIISGTYLNVPVKADSEAGREAAARTAAAAPAGKTYTVRRGDTLGRIARNHKISTAKLMKLNNLSDKDARRIKPGDKLKVSD